MERENKSAICAGEVEVSEAKKEVGIRSGVGKVGRHQTVIDQLELAPLDNTLRSVHVPPKCGKWKVEGGKCKRWWKPGRQALWHCQPPGSIDTWAVTKDHLNQTEPNKTRSCHLPRVLYSPHPSSAPHRRSRGVVDRLDNHVYR